MALKWSCLQRTATTDDHGGLRCGHWSRRRTACLPFIPNALRGAYDRRQCDRVMSIPNLSDMLLPGVRACAKVMVVHCGEIGSVHTFWADCAFVSVQYTIPRGKARDLAFFPSIRYHGDTVARRALIT